MEDNSQNPYRIILSSLSIGALVSGILLHWFFGELFNHIVHDKGIVFLIFAIVDTVLFIVLVCLLVAYLYKSNLFTTQKMFLSHLSGILQNMPFQWICVDTAFAEIELNTNANEIWVISPDLRNIKNPQKPFKRIVEENMKRGKKYFYIIPDRQEIIDDIKDCKEEYQKKYPNCFFYYDPIPKDDFKLISVSHLVIFRTRGAESLPLEVYSQMPVDKTYVKDKEVDYWIKYDDTASKLTHSRIYSKIKDKLIH